MLGFSLTWLVGAAGYLLLVGQVDPVEAAAAALCGLLAAVWSAAVLRRTRVRFEAAPGTWAAVARALAGIVPATVRVGLLLARSLVGRVNGEAADRRFRHGARRDPQAAERRAVVVLGLSLAPDAFALRLPEQQDLIVTHALGRSKGRPDPEWPV